jgi:cysteine desulfurase family protein (TIGR01976 family)
MAQTGELDIDFVRGEFPALASGWAFFENAGGSQVARPVIERMRRFASQMRVQPGYPYDVSAQAADELAEGQNALAAMINARPEEVVIGPSTTLNVYLLSHALAPLFTKGDEVIVTNLDHEANSGAWRRLAEVGLTVKEWRIDAKTGELEIDVLDSLLSGRTRLVAVTHCSNITGSVNDVAAIGRKVHDAGALLCVDGVSFAPHSLPDVKALDADFYLFSLYKLFGPHLAVLYGKREHLLAAKGQNHFFIPEDDLARKLKLGGAQFEASGAVIGIAEYFDALDAHHFERPETDRRARLERVYGLTLDHEARLSARFLAFVESRPEIRLIGRKDASNRARAPTFSFTVEGRRSAAFPPLLSHQKIGISNGNFYAYRCIEALGLEPEDGVVRVSLVHYNSLAEMDRLIAALEAAIDRPE